MAKRFGQKIREKRLLMNLKLEDVAAAIESTKTYVWELENKADARPSGEKLLALAKVLGLSVDFLLDDSKREQSEDHVAEAFFRKFNSLSKEDKERISRIADAIAKTDGKK